MDTHNSNCNTGLDCHLESLDQQQVHMYKQLACWLATHTHRNLRWCVSQHQPQLPTRTILKLWPWSKKISS